MKHGLMGLAVFSPCRLVASVSSRLQSVTRKYGENIRRHFRIRRYAGIEPFPILGNNCVAGRLCHDLGWPFLAPTVNLWMSVQDFVHLVGIYSATGMFPSASNATMVAETPYPIGTIEGSLIHFLHYRSFQEATSAWDRRLARLTVSTKDPVLVVSDNSDCSDEDIAAFLALPYRKRMVVHDRRKAALLGDSGVFFPLSRTYGTNISRTIGWSGCWLYQKLIPFDWLLGLNSSDRHSRKPVVGGEGSGASLDRHTLHHDK